MPNTTSAKKAAGLSPVPCEDLEGCDVRGSGRGLKREGIYIYLELIHVVVQQKLTQHCKAIIFQLKHKFFLKKEGSRSNGEECGPWS